MRREVVGLALAGFVVFGFVAWVAGMPKPSDAPLQAAPVVVATTAAADPATADATDASPEPQAPESAAGDGAAPTATAPASGPEPVVAAVSAPDTWAEETSAMTGIPVAALRIYADTAAAQEQQTPGCHLGWNMLAAVADPVDVAPEAIEASSRATAAQLCEGGADLEPSGGFEAALTAHGRSAAQARVAALLASAHAAASTI